MQELTQLPQTSFYVEGVINLRGKVTPVIDLRKRLSLPLPSLRRRALDPQVDLHPAAAAAREIVAGDWVMIETPKGRVRARARINEALDPQVVCGQHGWWQACPEIGAPGFEPFGPDSANFNLLIGHDDIDPVSGSVPLRAYICEIKRLL